MKNFYLTPLKRQAKSILLVVSFLISANYVFAEKPKQDCQNCFTTELISIERVDNCVDFVVKVDANNCIHALSHYTIDIPCGIVSSAENSGNWKMDFNGKDATTGLSGLKIDDIQNFGEDKASGTFTVSYTVCSDDEECLQQLETSDIIVAYKAGTCVFFETIKVSNNILEATINATDISCYGLSDGNIDVTVNNGTPPYQFLWNTSATTEDLNALPAGNYSVTITDANSQSLELSAVINQPEQIMINSVVTHANCGLSDGTITAEMSNGTAPYTYNWSTGDSTTALTNISGGMYTLTVYDAKGCSQTYNYSVIDKTTLTASLSTNIIDCHEEGAGTLTVSATGGSEPYTYLWDNGDTNATATGLTSGSHSVSVTDANGCTVTKTGYVVMQKLNAKSSVTEPGCTGEENATATITISNGTEPYNVQWNTGDTTQTINNIGSGWYWADITDANGCEYRKYVKVAEPSELNINASVTRSSCDESDSTMVVSVNASGGTGPYEIYYNDILLDSELSIEKEGYYSFSAIDATGCSVNENILIERPEATLNASASATQPNCDNPDYGSAIINISDGVGPYDVVWSDGNNMLERTSLPTGTYQADITDARGCTSSVEVNINNIEMPSAVINVPNEMPQCNSDNNIVTAVVENADQYKWNISSTSGSWTISSEQQDMVTYSAGTGDAMFSLRVTSIDGCVATDSLWMQCDAVENTDITDSVVTDSDTIDNVINTDCDYLSYTFEPVEIIKDENGCYTYKAKIITDGYSLHELSHMAVNVEDGTVEYVYNSNNWKTVLNSTDPTTGIYGFKIDDISYFGHSTDIFDLEFTICDTDNSPQTEFVIAYKSGQCINIDTVEYNLEVDYVQLKSYPNPFTDEAKIEFTSNADTNASLYIYDIYGKVIECIYDGPVQSGISYSFTFSPGGIEGSMFFYRLISGEHFEQGKLLRVK